jgi:hypothetical protein
VLFTSAGQLLGDLAALDSDSALRSRLRHYARPDLLAIDLCAAGSYVESPNTGSYFAIFLRVERRATPHNHQSRRSQLVMSSPRKT